MSAWELDVRPRKIRIFAWVAAAVIVAGATLGGVFARITSTGPRLTTADQISITGIGVVIAAGILLLTRSRLRANSDGIRVRNVFFEREFGWKNVLGVTFPERSPWARLELPADEYVPIMAIRANDGEPAADAIEQLRALGRRYGTQPEESAPQTPEDSA